MADLVHISSLMVLADPAQMETVEAEIGKIAAAETQVTDPSGKIIVTLVTESEAEIVNHLNELNLIDGVASASLVYHQTETEPEVPA
ncbi:MULTISPECIES: chaperone NapD [unclassified Ruegeria]|uniref:chaperone NapD n=1 Tax=unclassified Ruegeria TaxID=2625375 RepID=UPI0014876513|nr:chaperone NapD [Ruegeria sp. HKCCD8929]